MRSDHDPTPEQAKGSIPAEALSSLLPVIVAHFFRESSKKAAARVE
jgi:hypothetical protein